MLMSPSGEPLDFSCVRPNPTVSSHLEFFGLMGVALQIIVASLADEQLSALPRQPSGPQDAVRELQREQGEEANA
jgi:hypothetical protein